MAHSVEHEERLLEYALASPAEHGPQERARAAEQLCRCGECISFAYRALVDLPNLIAAVAKDAATVDRLRERCFERLDEALGQALSAQAAGEPSVRARREPSVDLGQLVRFVLRPWVWRPALGLALAAGVVVIVLRFLPQTAPTPELFLRAQLAEVREELPAGFSFAPARPPSAFWRGYARALLLDVEGSNVDEEEMGDLLSAVGVPASEASGQRARRFLRAHGCTGAPSDVSACGQGSFAYRARREAESGASNLAPSLRGEEAEAFLGWAEAEAQRRPRLSRVRAEIDAIQARCVQGSPPDAEERQRWVALIGELLHE